MVPDKDRWAKDRVSRADKALLIDCDLLFEVAVEIFVHHVHRRISHVLWHRAERDSLDTFSSPDGVLVKFHAIGWQLKPCDWKTLNVSEVDRLLAQNVKVESDLKRLDVSRALCALSWRIDTVLICTLIQVAAHFAELQAVLLGLNALPSRTLVRIGKRAAHEAQTLRLVLITSCIPRTRPTRSILTPE